MTAAAPHMTMNPSCATARHRSAQRGLIRHSEYAGERGFEMFRRCALETRAGEALQPADDEGGQHGSTHLRIDRGSGCVRRGTQALLERSLDLVEELVHALLQALVLEHQGVADHHAG